MAFFPQRRFLSVKSATRVDLSMSRTVRAAALAVAVFLVAVFLRSGDPLWLGGGVLCLMPALTEDRWIFDSDRRIVRRRYGFLPWPRSVDLPYGEVLAVFVEMAGRPDPAARTSSRHPHSRPIGKGTDGRASWGFALSTGADLTVCAGAPSRKDVLLGQAREVARILGVGLRGV